MQKISKDLNTHFSSVIPFNPENSLYFTKFLFIYCTGENLYKIQLLCFSSFISIGISILYAFVLVIFTFFNGYLKKKLIFVILLKINDNLKENFCLLKALKNI